MNQIIHVDLRFWEKFYVKQINEDYFVNILLLLKVNLVTFVGNFQLLVTKNQLSKDCLVKPQFSDLRETKKGTIVCFVMIMQEHEIEFVGR